MDSTRPPQIIVLDVAPCRDSVTASDELRQSLAPAAAPGPDWKVRVRFERAAGRITVRGEVMSPTDETVASRTLSNAGVDCASLARGVGVWAALVLDAEVNRAKGSAPAPAPPPAERAAPPAPAVAARAAGAGPASPDDADAEAARRSPEAEVFLAHSKDERTVELGLASFVMGGTGGGAVVGASLFGVFEASHGFFLRPEIVAGHSVGGLSQTSEAPATFLDSRFDACARVPGFYREGRGLQLDLCGGAEVGFSRVDDGVIATATPATAAQASTTLPFIALGPSLGIRGELSKNLSAVVRGVGDVSLLRDPVTLASSAVVTPPVFAGRAEVGLSWTLR